MTLFESQIQNRQILVSDQLLIQYFKNNGLELTFRQICTNHDSGSVEFLDVNHCIAVDSVFGFVTKDFVKPTSVGRRFIPGSSHHPPSTFKSIIFGEAIRLRRLNERKLPYKPKYITEQSKRSKFPVNMTNDMITLVSKWQNRLHPPNPSDKKNYSVWPTSFPSLLRLTKKEKTLNNEAMITYKRPTTVGQLLTNYRSLAHSEASNQQQRGQGRSQNFSKGGLKLWKQKL